MTGKEKQESLEQSMARLEAIVAELERGEQPLEEALSKFEEGLKIGKRCREILDKAEGRVRRLIDVADDGTITDEDFDTDA